MWISKLFLDMNNSPYPPQAHQSTPQQYHQQQKPLSMPVPFLNPDRQRKIIANVCGMVVAVMIILFLLICISLNLSSPNLPSDPHLRCLFLLITGYSPLTILHENPDLGILILVLHFVLCLIFLYAPIRSLCQKSFTAGQPSKVQMWPLAIAIVVKIVIEIILITKNNLYPAQLLFHRILFTICFATYVFSIYTADDDNLKSGQVNMKPWVFEKEDILLK